MYTSEFTIKAAGITDGFTVFIFAIVNPFDVPNDELLNITEDEDVSVGVLPLISV